ncbi:glycosyltransferase family 4 protein [Candidatus Venteria ishoeyi]|uniref:D-inositol 3-phosphate glycosyltransferase n=1 Tax=Candidatus Venteria ishoeyi TaxID=1899563 RepID=A0A1H6FBB3_9GAMM|nr:glycosyltransferase family 4 protein [Candidatus Venteria ishoeyi]MDM8548058.1 glycosyltransferase family 4 protein [Candidatus Venteria ishoeyi]SEH06619.1 D-inositol 3-phosphate glycosyltransferase [Candidatus Venteria ishoeyi]
MKIMVAHYQYQLGGGMESYLLDLCRGFAIAGDEVDVWVYKHDQHVNVPDGVRINRKKLRWIPKKLRHFVFPALLQPAFCKADLSLALSLNWGQDVQISGGTHLGFLQTTGRQPNLLDKWKIKLEHKAFQQAQYIVAHSPMIMEEIQVHYGVPMNKIKMLYPPLDTEKFHRGYRSQKNLLRKQFGLSQDKFVLLFPSTGHVRKGLQPLLKALELLPPEQFELCIVGSKLPSNASRLSNVKALGFVNEMAKVYSAVDVTILPSFYEPFGLVVTESLQCGTPVIISRYVGAGNLVDNNCGKILKDLSPDTLSCAIQETSQQHFNIPEDFVEQHQLQLSNHIQQLRLLHL